ncbi:MAG: twin-arginine translocation pathway signal protein [Candidatus Competibacteraceae bacterium]|nr:MAG: twin-arginine translocation pathway signal protein [Candidatus Competibacteraceae bacterium]
MSSCKSAGMSIIFAALLALLIGAPTSATAASAAEINRNAANALADLYRQTPAAKALARQAKAILVFPSVVKGGLLIGGEYGQGVLRQGEKAVGYYETVAVSYGLQAGAQSFSYVLFFMTDSAVQYAKESKGWEFGVGPSVVVLDEGMAKTLTTTTTRSDIYAFVFGQQGLMAGVGLKGSKITRIWPGP